MRLRDRWFPSAGEIESEERERLENQQEELAQIARFSASWGFDYLVTWLTLEKENNQPVPGAERDMLYACGLRDGFGKVLDHLQKLKVLAQENKDARE